MTYMVLSPGTVEVPDRKNLLAAWRLYGRDPHAGPLVGRFIVRQPLTDSQLRRLPAGLRDLVSSPDDFSFLERLYRLEDPRDAS